ncbi:ferrienterobactin-binding periplasmic protein [Rhodococcus sp. MTM3W5.2]|nr:ferrienterobactin-binding periplasmic protein [Rhodococcus sp. MTM3W5.2]
MIGATAVGCSSEEAPAQAPAVSESGAWPRTVDTARGPVTVETQPQRIVSTSVTLTGALLSLDAPLIGTGAQPKSTVTDENGLFSQWAGIALQRGVDVLYQGVTNIEKITAATPDLIVVAARGGDSAAEQYDLLSKIAPTLVFDYTDKSWQELTTQIADAIGAEDRAGQLINEFDTKVAAARSTIAPALQAGFTPVNLLTYNSPQDSRMFTAESAQGQLVDRLGMALAPLPADIANADKGVMAGRADVVPVGLENLSRALPGAATFIINAEQPAADALAADPTLQGIPSVQRHAVFALGYDSFRLDYYSAGNFVDRVVNELT